MNICFKEGVSIAGLKDKIFQAIFATAQVFDSKQLILTVTSTTEYHPERKKDSFHYEGKAFDIRTRRIPEKIQIQLVEKLRQALLPIDRNFQVVLKKDHIHIELDDRSKI